MNTKEARLLLMHTVELIYHTLTLEQDVILSVWTVKDFGETVTEVIASAEVSQGFVMYLHGGTLRGFLVLQLPGSGRCWNVTVCHHSSHLSSHLFQHISTVRARNSDSQSTSFPERKRPDIKEVQPQLSQPIELYIFLIPAWIWAFYFAMA